LNNPIFQYDALPGRVVFGAGAIARLPEEAARLRLKRVLIVSTAGQRKLAERAGESLGSLAVGIFAKAVMHTPSDITETALLRVADLRADGIVAIGGGSAIGLSKALALRTDLPQIAIPTTYAGSEATPILGETIANEKRTQRSEKVLPETILYDVYLTIGLPTSVSMASGLNAMAHAVEALYAPDRNPLTNAMAEAALKALIDALPEIHDRADDVEARTKALWGAWLSGCCLGVTTMGLHHKLCHTLGGTAGLPHAETHAVLLSHALDYNLSFAPEAHRTLIRLCDDPDPPRAIAEFIRRLSLPKTLSELGMPEDAIDRVADMTVSKPYPNPRPLERAAIRDLLARAWSEGFPLARTMKDSHARF
jgi:alcohol dehydrogenase class IV